MNRDFKVYRDPEELSSHAAAEIARLTDETLKERETCSVALSGGTTPRNLYRLLAIEYAHRIPWNRVHVFWADERYVPHDDPASNYELARRTLIDHVSLPASNIHPMPVTFPDPSKAAEEYELTLRQYFGERPKFDLMLLGVGTDGHTASLFPGSAALSEQRAWAVNSRAPVKPHIRLTLTLPVLNSSRQVMFLVAGEEKREIVKSILGESDGGARYPAGRVTGIDGTEWYLDKAAAANLT